MSPTLTGRLRAARHERRVIWAANPALGALIAAARFGPAVVKVPKLGWLVRDPRLIRQVLIDHGSTSLLGEGGVGHLWAQVLGDWVYEKFDGAGHHSLRTRARDLFTGGAAERIVERVARPALSGVTASLQSGGLVDIADVGRVLVGRMVAEMLGIDVRGFAEDSPGAATSRVASSGAATPGAGKAHAGKAHAGTADADQPYRMIFALGEQLASLAIGTAADTSLSQHTVARARRIVARLTAQVPQQFRTAPSGTVLGRCRELGLTEQEATGLSALLLVAGTETAASAIARTVALLADSGQVRWLAAAVQRQTRQDLLDIAVREGLRVTTPAPVIGRHVTADLRLGGRQLRAGDRLVALVYAANTGAGAFDLTRAYLPQNRQLWFGAGRHLCLGAAVARAELREVLTALLAAGPWRIVRRAPERRALIPTYRELVVAAA